ncbi:MAG: hypothetical protein RR382_00060 [Tannerellaceae bacterium]
MDTLNQLTPFEAGLRIGAIQNGTTTNQIHKSAAFVDACMNDDLICNQICKAASLVFAAVEDEPTVESVLFTNLALKDSYSTITKQAYILPALDAFAENEVMTKQASLFGMIGTVGKAGTLVPGGLKTILAASAAAGLAGGGLVWGLKRDSTTDDMDIVAQKEQIRQYQQLAGDIRQKIKLDKLRQQERARAQMENEYA